MDILWSTLAMLVTTSYSTGVSQTGCDVGEFPYSQSEGCNSNTCPGHCVDLVCCVDDCFDITNMRTFRENCQHIAENTTCSRFSSQMRCLAKLMNSTADICTKQVYQQSKSNILTGTFNPAECPCNDGYVKVANANPFMLLYCQTNDSCYEAYEDSTNTTLYCLNQTMLPDTRACLQNETLSDRSSAILMPCTAYCSGICRQMNNQQLLTCCVYKKETTDTQAEVDGGLQVGYIILITVSVIVVISLLLFGLVYCARFKKLFRKDQSIAGLTDLSEKSM